MTFKEVVSFELCAAHFLLQWRRKEERLHTELSFAPSAEVLRIALSFFIVARNFSGLKKDAGVAKQILDALLEVDSIVNMSMEDKVKALASRFREGFGKNNISAASKLLWLRNRAPYIIYDSRAEKSLKAMGAKFRSRDYDRYCSAWRDEYVVNESKIVNSVRNLYHINKVLPDWPQSTEEIQSMIQSVWFKERVFDIYLYQNSDGL